MVEIQSVSTEETMGIQSGPDLLSDLHLSIIHLILARVPFRDAVRTSVLSRQWRYTWVTLPSLVFDYSCVNSTSVKDISIEESLIDFIFLALFKHKGPIHKCTISFPSKHIFLEIDEWILLLAENDIKELTLDMGERDYHDSVLVPSSINSCEKLTKLELQNCYMDPPSSTFKGLRCLVLRDVHMPPDAVESLVANSPLLETFELREVSVNKVLRISAPNLKHLDILGNWVEFSVYAPLLADMSVTLVSGFTTRYQQQKSSVCNYTKFMGGFTNLEKLSGRESFTKYLKKGIEFCTHAVVFHQLKHIELQQVNFRDIRAVSVVARLVAGAPNLQKLEIDTGDHKLDGDGESEGDDKSEEDDESEDDDSDEDDELEEDDESEEDAELEGDGESEGDDKSEASYLSFMDFGCGPNFTFEKLKVVKILSIRGLQLEMKFVKFLIESSAALETMELGYLHVEYKLKLAAELLGFCRASSKAKISVTSF